MLFFRKIFADFLGMSNWFLFAASFVLILFSSYLIYFLEPDNFQSPFNGFWWVMTTVTTVGYGDFYPKSVAGKYLAIFLYLFGISLIGVVIGKIMDAFYIFKKSKEEGKLAFKGENHIVIVDWSKNAELAIREILKSDTGMAIVLIDQLEKTPIDNERVHYVKGSPTKKETLVQANLAKAKAVLIFANEFTENGQYIQDADLIDGKTLLIATALERNFEHIYTVVEIKEEESIANFKHIKVDEFILSNEIVSRLAVRSAFSPGASKIFSQLLSRQLGDDLYEINKRPHWKTYGNAFQELLQEGATLISDGQNLNINRRLQDPIPQNARLFVVCDKKTFDVIKNKK